MKFPEGELIVEGGDVRIHFIIGIFTFLLIMAVIGFLL